MGIPLGILSWCVGDVEAKIVNLTRRFDREGFVGKLDLWTADLPQHSWACDHLDPINAIIDRALDTLAAELRALKTEINYESQ